MPDLKDSSTSPSSSIFSSFCAISPSSLNGVGRAAKAATRPHLMSLGDERHLAGLRALRALLDLVLDGRALVQALVALAFDCAEVDEHVVAALGLRDEAVALLCVEPLDGSGSHIHTSSSTHERAAERRKAKT